ncbi:uncharacterized protein PpBr36_06766 [Pyricularia pennisetigena]|uniref:uncharacterized protein n=1 Tax=Pyricularia pennisetigena TaxID=1578925 RepID=UPI00114FD81B|nr:uncharacterized protein PpBr36_06766 [Pyricularia pennisetigena]TLS22686.1 hypothetical protein PpBr36_06766 [Pyricularia pennisetigena]
MCTRRPSPHPDHQGNQQQGKDKAAEEHGYGALVLGSLCTDPVVPDAVFGSIEVGYFDIGDVGAVLSVDLRLSRSGKVTVRIFFALSGYGLSVSPSKHLASPGGADKLRYERGSRYGPHLWMIQTEFRCVGILLSVLCAASVLQRPAARPMER